MFHFPYSYRPRGSGKCEPTLWSPPQTFWPCLCESDCIGFREWPANGNRRSCEGAWVRPFKGGTVVRNWEVRVWIRCLCIPANRVWKIRWTSIFNRLKGHTFDCTDCECAFDADSSVHTLMRIGVDAHSNSHPWNHLGRWFRCAFASQIRFRV